MLRLIIGALLLVMLQAPAWALSFTTVGIDAGHGGKDGGCVHHGLIEKKLCLDLALRLERVLKAKGLRVVMTRRTDTFVSLTGRTEIANRQKNALFVSLHFNGNQSKAISGMEVFYRSQGGKAVAAKILRSMDVNCKGVKRGLFFQDLKVLRATRMTAVLVEGGYLSNKTDASRCATAYHREELAKAIASGILASRS